MGYNVLSGNVLLPGQLLADGQVSSSAFVGDGKELEHVLKITSGPDQYNLTTIGTDAYNGVNLFEGTTPAPAPTSGQGQGPLDGVAPSDPGVDISSIFSGHSANIWQKLSGKD